MGRSTPPSQARAVTIQIPANKPAGAAPTGNAQAVAISAQLLIGRGRPVWRPMFYGGALIAFATALTVLAPTSSWWFIYGLACDLMGVCFLPVAAVRLRQSRDLKAATAELAAAGGVIAPFRPVPAQAKPTNRPKKPGPVSIARSAPAGGLPGLKVTQLRVIRSEWTKFRSLRSSKIVVFVAAAVIVGMAAIIAAVINSQWDKISPDGRKAFNPAVTPMAGVGLAQLAFGVLGVLFISGEYATGMIRSSLTAVPQRARFFLGKLVVLTGVVGTTALVAVVTAFQLAQWMWTKHHIQTHLGAPGTLRPVLGAALYLMLISMFAMGLGVLLRHTAAAITSAVVALLFLAPTVIGFLPAGIGATVTELLPAQAGAAFWSKPSGGWRRPAQLWSRGRRQLRGGFLRGCWPRTSEVLSSPPHPRGRQDDRCRHQTSGANRWRTFAT